MAKMFSIRSKVLNRKNVFDSILGGVYLHFDVEDRGFLKVGSLTRFNAEVVDNVPHSLSFLSARNVNSHVLNLD